ncbi:MAG: chromosomal replication initiator protein DnaA [Bacteroidales bacterium]|nr:chromosomal replication initiator protein DnaA [Bacteroidales bacterium]
MNNAAADKWKACLEYIRTNLEATEYAKWFEPLDFYDYKDGQLMVDIPSKEVGDYIGQHYRDLVANALGINFGQKTQLIWRNKRAIEEFRQGQLLKQTNSGSAQQATPQTVRNLPPLNANLNASYTFENFVTGVSNKLAVAVATSIADNPGQITFNPFFLYGPSGVGKTHLVNAIGIRLQEKFPEKRVLFVSAHLFKTQYTDSVIHNTSNDFINFYQSIDVLIIDDIQEITTARTQQTFFHIFNHLQQNRRQLIITCDRPPVLFEGFEERMLTRFKWGMVAEIEKPDTALRKAILESKIRRDGLSIPKEVVQYIAQNVESSVRELEGIINGLMAYSVVDNCDIDLNLTSRVVARIVNLEKKELTADDILSAVCQHYGLKQREIVSKSRKQNIAQARQLAMYLIHKYTDMSYSQIGRRFGGRDHSTVLHGCNQVARRISVDKDFRHEVEALEAVLKK